MLYDNKLPVNWRNTNRERKFLYDVLRDENGMTQEIMQQPFNIVGGGLATIKNCWGRTSNRLILLGED